MSDQPVLLEVKGLKKYFVEGGHRFVGDDQLGTRGKGEAPSWEEVEPEHFSLCHFAKELDLKGGSSVRGVG